MLTFNRTYLMYRSILPLLALVVLSTTHIRPIYMIVLGVAHSKSDIWLCGVFIIGAMAKFPGSAMMYRSMFLQLSSILTMKSCKCV